MIIQNISIEDLQAEMIPPFYKDEAWENKGSLIWHKHVVIQEQLII